jgi:cytochrome c peroxidase
VERDDQWIETGQLELPFAPRELVFVGESTLIVTDAYGGNLAVVDIDQGVRVVHHVNGHNLYGLSVSPQQDRIVFNMQRLNSFRPTTYEDIFWGGVMQNITVELMLRDVLRPAGEEGLNESVYFLGRPSEGTGDPTALLLSADGVAVIALGGVHQVAIRPTPYAPLEYRAVGKRPIALARPADGRTVYVLCQMDDSLHELNLDTLQVTRSLNLSPDVQPDLAAQGEAFFYDATLALDGWFSCHSCHSDGHTNGLLNDNFGDDSQGAPKRVPSLLGTADTGPWGWTGRMQTLEDQVRKSLTRTMHGGRADENVVAAITAYLRTLPAVTGAEHSSTYQSRNDGPTSNNGGPISKSDGPINKTDRVICTTDGPISKNESLNKNSGFFNGDENALRRGAALFERHGCSDCHQPPTFTSAATYDVGLHDEVGNKLFNPPSLRGLFLRDTFFHDSRATSLRDVFLKYKHPSDISWSNEDLDDLLTYLKSL